jgi:hypothetical protein
MTRLLLASILAWAPAAGLAAEAPAVKGCCQRPQENPPRAPQKRSLCSGTMWSLASHGRCVPGAADGVDPGTCREAVFSTLVMVKEYALSWDERLKECVLVSTGRAWPTVVAACDGNSC